MTLRRTTKLRPFSEKRLRELAEAGVTYPTSTFKPTSKKATAKRVKDTGPKRSVAELVRERAGGMCEWRECPRPDTETHHRLNRKQGGRHGEASDRVNGAAWLLRACRVHHAYVTSPFGHRRRVARAHGWLLMEHEDAAQVPVWTRHSDQPVYLSGDGRWIPFEELCA